MLPITLLSTKGTLNYQTISITADNHIASLNLQAVKSKPETVTEEMLDEDLKEDELSDSEGPPTVPDMEQEEAQPSNVSNKYAH